MDEDQLRDVMRHVLTEQKKLRGDVDQLRQDADAAHQRGRTVAIVAMLAILLAVAVLGWLVFETML